MRKLLIVAIGLLGQPALAGTAGSDALARDLLVCAGKFGALAFVGQGGHAAEGRAYFDAATKLAGADFVKREAPAANEKAADWVFAKDGTPTFEQARDTCSPLLKRAAVD